MRALELLSNICHWLGTIDLGSGVNLFSIQNKHDPSTFGSSYSLISEHLPAAPLYVDHPSVPCNTPDNRWEWCNDKEKNLFNISTDYELYIPDTGVIVPVGLTFPPLLCL